MEKFCKEIVWVGDVGVPRVEMDWQLRLVDQVQERRPVGQVMQFRRDAHGREPFLDQLELAHDVGSLRTRPDREGRKASPTWVACLCEQLMRLL